MPDAERDPFHPVRVVRMRPKVDAGLFTAERRAGPNFDHRHFFPRTIRPFNLQ